MRNQWGTKTYLTDRERPPLPALIDQVCREIVQCISWSSLLPDEQGVDSWQTSYQPEGGIINFYGVRSNGRLLASLIELQTKDSLTGHIDHSEAEASRPLVSISLGLDAVFLVGGETRQTKPLPMLLRSGDVVLMSGPTRRVFHGSSSLAT
jgi:alkylated DNA repair protein alkB family protein 1